MATNVESGIDMNSSSDLPDDFSSPERIPTATKITPRALVYDIDVDEMPAMIRRRTLGAFAKNNNNNETHDCDKTSMDDDDETSKLISSRLADFGRTFFNWNFMEFFQLLWIFRRPNGEAIATNHTDAVKNALGIATVSQSASIEAVWHAGYTKNII